MATAALCGLKLNFKTDFNSCQPFLMLVTTHDFSYNSAIRCSVIIVHAAINKLQNLDLKRQKYPESWVMIDIELHNSRGRPMQLTVNKIKHFKSRIATC